MSETKDFVDVILPILEAGTWTNYLTANSKAPNIVVEKKSGPGFSKKRGNVKNHVSIKNEDGADESELTFDGVIIQDNLSGQIQLTATKKSDRNLMKTDLMEILRKSSIPFEKPRINNNPSVGNRDSATYFLRIISC